MVEFGSHEKRIGGLMLAVVVGTQCRLPLSQAHVSVGNYRGEFSKAVGQGLLLLLIESADLMALTPYLCLGRLLCIPQFFHL